MNHYIPDNIYNNMTPEERERLAFLEGDRQTMEYCDTIEDLTLELERQDEAFSQELAAAEQLADDYQMDYEAAMNELADREATLDELKVELKFLKEGQ